MRASSRCRSTCAAKLATKNSAAPTSGRVGKEFLKPIGLNETKEMLMSKGRPSRCANLHLRRRSLAKSISHAEAARPMHYVLKNDKKNAPAPRRSVRQGAHLHRRGKRPADRFSRRRRGKFTRLTTRCASISASRKTWSSTHDREKRRSSRRRKLHDYEVIVKFEIENRKDQR